MGEYKKAIMLGNLTRDPDLCYTLTGMPVCEFRSRLIIATG
ncbi:MAG TPA: hypothetical protein VGH22_09855 [Candidatus Binatia bacterium]|jgi:single-stranded DNA-binding protein